jgi:hypothetical protein
VRIICRVDKPEVDCVLAVYADPTIESPTGRIGMIHAISPLSSVNFLNLPSTPDQFPCLWSSKDLEKDWFWDNFHSMDGHLAPFLMELLQIVCIHIYHWTGQVLTQLSHRRRNSKVSQAVPK